MSALFECDLAVVEDTATIGCRGEFAFGVCESVFDAIALVRPEVTNLVFDLGQVTFIDSTGIRALLAARALLEERGGKVILRDLSEVAERVLDALGLDDAFVIEFTNP